MNTNSSWCKDSPDFWLSARMAGGRWWGTCNREHATEKFHNYRYLYKCLVVENYLLNCFESEQCNSVAALQFLTMNTGPLMV